MLQNDRVCDKSLFAQGIWKAQIAAMNKDEAKPHVLLVEDARDIREPLARYLREHGYRSTTAPDAASARKVMKAAAIDLVVLDIMMPGEDGLSLCRSIRETSQIPVILLTARGEEVDRIIGLEMGADVYIAKPFSPRELIARVAAVLRRTPGAAAPPEAARRRAHPLWRLDAGHWPAGIDRHRRGGAAAFQRRIPPSQRLAGAAQDRADPQPAPGPHQGARRRPVRPLDR